MAYLRVALMGVAASILCTLLLLTTAYARADQRTPQTFDIQPQSLGTALTEFARQSHENILFAPEVVAQRHSAGVHGTMAPLAALDILLKDSGLPFNSTPNGAILIGVPNTALLAPAVVEPAGESQKEGKSDSSGGFRVGQVGQGADSQSSTVTSTTSNTQEGSNKVGLEEVVVTAQKREERAFDVPVSIVAVSADELAKRNITSIDDLPMAVPGLSVVDGGNFRQIALRGIGNTYGSASEVGIYLDEADVTSNLRGQLALDTYDLQRVEVLRGPQGTLYGEGSLGGTVRFITNNPGLNQIELIADVATLTTQNGAPSERIQEVVNVPLIAGTLGLRIAGQFDHEGGWINQPAANLTNINYQDQVDVRPKLSWQPVEQFMLSAMAEIHRDNEVPSIGEDANGNYTQVFNLTTTPRVQDDYNLYNLTLTYDFAAARLLNTTTYFSHDNRLYNSGEFFYGSPPPAPPSDIYAKIFTKQTSLSDEIRLTSNGSGPWQWTAGAFFKRFQLSDFEPFYFGPLGPPGTPLPAEPIIFTYNGESKAWSVFVDTSYKLTDRLTVGAGVREYSDDEGYYFGSPQSASFHSVDPRFYASFKLSDQINVYASAAKGFRSGGFNSSPTAPTYAPEQLWTYELGSKISFPDEHVNIDADIFYTKDADYITFGLPPGNNGTGGIYQNAGDAVIKGIEFDSTLRLAEQWTLSLSGDYLDTYFTAINLAPTSAPYAVGDNIDFINKYQGTASLQRDFTWSSRSGFVRLDYSLQGPATYRNRSIGAYYFSESNTINMVNLNTGVHWSDHLDVRFFAQNLLNDRGFTGTDVIEQAAPRARPRTYGASFRVKF